MIDKIRIDVGLSSTGPNAAYWLSKYSNLLVIGVEPNPFNVEKLKDGSHFIKDEYTISEKEQCVKLNNDVISLNKEKNNVFKLYDVAIDDVESETSKTFYCTSQLNTGCSSLHRPIESRLNGVTLEKEIDVRVLSLKRILDEVDWNGVEFIEYLKTDTQSNDLNVIKSCKEYLNKICFIQSEYYAHSAYEGEKTQEECFADFNAYMIENGFKCYYVSGTDVAYVNTNLIPYIFENNIVNDSIEFKNGHNWL